LPCEYERDNVRVSFVEEELRKGEEGERGRKGRVYLMYFAREIASEELIVQLPVVGAVEEGRRRKS
jgi:hypothetical protein